MFEPKSIDPEEGQEILRISLPRIVKEGTIPQCEGCSKAHNNLCDAYGSPRHKWANGRCPLAPFIPTKEQIKKFTDPIKLSKQMSKGPKGASFVPKTKSNTPRKG